MISEIGRLTAAKTMVPNFLFSVLGGVQSPLAIVLTCSQTFSTATSNGTWKYKRRGLATIWLKDRNSLYIGSGGTDTRRGRDD